MIENKLLQEIKFPQEKDKEQYKKLMEQKSKELACPNEHCETFGIIGKGNILFRRKYGKKPSQNLFVCKTCKKRFLNEKELPFLDFIYLKRKFLRLFVVLLKEMVHVQLLISAMSIMIL